MMRALLLSLNSGRKAALLTALCCFCIPANAQEASSETTPATKQVAEAKSEPASEAKEEKQESAKTEASKKTEAVAVATATSSDSSEGTASAAATVEKPVSEKTESDDQSNDGSETESRLEAIENRLEKLTEVLSTMAEQKGEESSEASKGAEEKAPAEQGRRRPSPGGRKAPEPVQFSMKPEWLKSMNWRSLGPANMSGRVTDIEVNASDTSTWWIATGGGGLLKTVNHGTTIEHQFDHEDTVSIGAIASDPSDAKTLWVGTGEINPRNSVSYGNGVYKSTDGGKTFEHMGLEETYQIARILIHPENSDVVYVGAAGRLYGTNEARGVYKTSDGGKTWDKVLYLDERTGVIDMIMNPEDPETLIVGMWDRLRDEFDSWPGSVPKPDGIDGYDPIRKWGPKAGLYKTTDGGENWSKLSKGLPSGMTGRIGLDWQQNSPNTIYAIIDCEDIGKGPKPFSCYLGLVGNDESEAATITQVMPGSPADKAGIQVGDQLQAADEQQLYKFDELLAVLREKEPGERIQLSLKRGKEELEFAPKLAVRPGSRGTAAQPYYGIVGEDQGGRVALTQVTAKGPADKAGLQVGDVVLSFNETEPKDYADWIKATADLAIGDKVALKIERDGKEESVVVELGKKPGTGPTSSAYMGIRGQNQASGGAILSSVTEGGPADKAGIKANDVVVKVGDKSIKTYEDLIEEIRARKAEEEMPVEVRRGDKTVKATVVLGDRNAGTSDRPYTFSYFGQLPNAQDQQGANGHEYGGVYKSTDAGESWMRVNSINIRPMYFSVIKVDPNDDQRVYLLGVSQYQSDNGGQTFTSDFGRGVHSDSHDLWIDPADGRHMVIGSDGGYYVTHDRGQNWDHINTAALGQFYHVTIAPTKPYSVYGGLQDNGSWGGPAVGLSGSVINQDWISVGGGDGFVCRVDPEDPDVVYSESQNGSIRRRNLRTGAGASIRPRPQRGQEFRFNWNTPFILSHHNSKVFYSAGNYVFRSYDRGDNLKTISPEITRTKRGSGTALSESKLDPDVVYAGTDDGALWVTKDGGANWKDISANLGVDPMWVSTIEASKFDRATVYVCLDGHRSDNDDPHIFVSKDFGDTFTSLSKDLPRGSTRCLREDIVNRNVLYLGTEYAFWVSVDAGLSWTQFNQELPSVAIHEVAQREGVDEIVLATHGRSLWACDVTALRGMSLKDVQEKVVLMDPADVIRWRRDPRRGRTNRRFASENPSSSASIWYSVPKDVESATVKVLDITGGTLAELRGGTSSGLHSVRWNLTQSAGRGRVRSVPTGRYRISLLIDEKEAGSKILEVKADPTLAPDAISESEFEAVEELLEIGEEDEADALGDLD
ncbi:MAG: PDZ domain-containing protein [Planctomycetota bacterium]